MNLIKKFLEQQKPFAIMQYFGWLRHDRDREFRIYELMFERFGNIRTHQLDLSAEDLVEILNDSRITKVVQNDNGSVYEFKNFTETLSIMQCEKFIKQELRIGAKYK